MIYISMLLIFPDCSCRNAYRVSGVGQTLSGVAGEMLSLREQASLPLFLPEASFPEKLENVWSAGSEHLHQSGGHSSG